MRWVQAILRKLRDEENTVFKWGRVYTLVGQGRSIDTLSPRVKMGDITLWTGSTDMDWQPPFTIVFEYRGGELQLTHGEFRYIAIYEKIAQQSETRR